MADADIEEDALKPEELFDEEEGEIFILFSAPVRHPGGERER